MLHGAVLDKKLWELSFYFRFLCKNITLHSGDKATTFDYITVRKPDLSFLRIFGC